jgi:hypothetical protein
MPLWNDIGESLRKEMNDYPFSSPLDSISAFCHEFSRASLIERLRSILHVDVARPGATHLSFCNLKFNTVITTNFDFLLERSYDLIKRPYLPIIDEDQLSVSDSSNHVRLLKIHGDLNHPSRLVATEQDYDIFIERYPLMCTYIASLLISRTPLFIGYSLEDPDFRQIWQIVGTRLGNLRRSAYALSVSVRSADIARYERRGVKVISLGERASDYSNMLKTLFEELDDYWKDKIPEISTIIDEGSLIELSLPRDAQTRLCFFAIPSILLSFYRSYIFPIFERYGFTPITATDVIAPGENIAAKISSLIDRATLMIADISSSQAVISEINMALTRNRRIIIIREEDAKVPYDVASIRYITRPKIMDPLRIGEFISVLEEYLKEISTGLIDQLSDEPRRLLKKGESRAAVISAIILLEAELRERVPEKGKLLPLTRLIDFSIRRMEIDIPEKWLSEIRQWIMMRNLLVHSKESISHRKADQIVNDVMTFVQMIREKVPRSRK